MRLGPRLPLLLLVTAIPLISSAERLAVIEGPLGRASALDLRLRALLEKLRESMRSSNSSFGFPLLDPYAAELLPLELREPNVRVNGSLRALRVEGASNFSIGKASARLAGLRIELELLWPEVRLDSLYTLDGTLVESIPFFGHGDISLTANGIRTSATASLGSRAETRKLYLKSLDLGLYLEKLNMTVSGLWEDEEFSKTISAIISDMGPKILEDYQEFAVDYCRGKLTDLADEYLGRYTLQDLIDKNRGE